MNNYTLNFSVLEQFSSAFIFGLLTTIALSMLSIVAGTLLAFPLVRGTLVESSLIRTLAIGWINLVRAIPLLVLLTGAYYITPALTGLKINSFLTAAVVFTVYLSTFVADILRNAVRSVPESFFQTGMALGMDRSQINRHIILPVVLRSAMIPVFSMYLSLIKYTSLASAISVHELLHVADLIVLQKLRPVEAYTAVAVLYLLIIIPLSLLSRQLESRLGSSFGRNRTYDA